ncbi:MAG: M48 family metalloprotease [Desulfoarculaceae bacterium]|nr:M48 family metalloprotease [Desulfoarculaceae bacterium]
MKKNVQKIWAMVLACSLLHFSLAARPAFAFTVGEEREVGEILLYQTRLAFPLIDDPDIYQYINDLGAEVLRVSSAHFFDYRFFVIKNKEFNAFAAPSGLIFFHSGLIETMHSEDELVSVMAHEVGHVVSRHIASRMKKGTKVGIGAMALAIAGLALGGGGVAGQALVTGSMAASQALNLHFSRQDEEEADLLSYGWMKKMGRDTASMEKMLTTMRRITRYRMGQVPQYLLTHPDPEARLGYVQSLIAVDGASLSTQSQADDFAFLRAKYRILSQLEDEGQFRNFLAMKIADPKSSSLEKNMARYGLSQVEREANNYDRSHDLLREVIAAYPDRSILLVDLGRVELAAGNKDKALALFLEAKRQNPEDLWAVFQLAMVYLELGQLKEAEANLFTLAREIPEYSKIYYELGKLRSTQGEKGEASFYLGKYYLYEGRIELARDNFEKVIKETSLARDIRDNAEKMLETIERLEDGPGSKKKQEEKKRKEEAEGKNRLRLF